MQTVPVIPDSAPFTLEQRAWLNGFIAGLVSRGEAAGISNLRSQISDSAALAPLTILWGSQTGSSEGLARRAAKEAGRRGFAATVMDMADYAAERLAQEKNVLLITSTYGDGEPPDNARALHAALRAEGSSSLTEVKFSVCGLGDTNYTLFCQCGKDFDAALEKLGATRAAPRADCDVDYESAFTAWLDAALAAFAGAPAEPSSPAFSSAASAAREAPYPVSNYTRANPFHAPLLAARRLSAASSAKEVNHVEFSLEGSGLAYEAGDALGVYPHNCGEHAAEVLAALGCDGEEAVPAPDGSEIPLRRALTEFYDLGRPSADLTAALGDSAHGAFHVVDALASAGGIALAPVVFVTLLKRLQPRLYSIASSPRAHPGKVHLTVGAVRYELHGRRRKGVCSTFLPERAPGLGSVPVFVHANKSFRPPADDGAPMIMIGPGTGIAPFRAFLEERRARGAKGRNWLFFGDQRETTDFLYREELLAFHRDGFLARLDLAWSRDQADKVYVQHRMLEQAKELFAWLEAGAHLYVCGDASRMAKDVDAALHQIVANAGGKTTEGAAGHVQALKAAKRYQRDVY
ncbi:MAG: sulfite reductase subunit alpha [Opitutaceae bacterium]